MAESDKSADELVTKQKEFVDAFFKKGAEFTEELLRENEKLRFRVVQLEEQIATTTRAIPSPATLKELVEKIHNLEQERAQLERRFTEVKSENSQYEARYHQIERENHNLASLYVAAYQMHSTFDLHEVLQTIIEILLNFVGAKAFALLLCDDAGVLHPVITEGMDRTHLPLVKTGQGVIGQVVETGQPFLGWAKGAPKETRGPKDEPLICIALRMKDGVVGALAIWDFLTQKTELAEVDFEIFNLIGAHAASALEAARLAAEAGGAPQLRFSRLNGLL